MAELQTAPEIARAIADALEERGIGYAIGGAIALGYYAVPRATVDVDVNVFVAAIACYAELAERRRQVPLLGRVIFPPTRA